MHRGTPSLGRSPRRGNYLYGATANFARNASRDYSARSFPESFSGSNDRIPTSWRQQPPALNRGGGVDSHAPRDSTTSLRIGANIMDPTPVQSLITRLNTPIPVEEESPRMKVADNLPADLTYSGSSDDWFDHMDNLELDVFQKHGCNI